MASPAVVTKWTKEAEALLVGRKITAVSYSEFEGRLGLKITLDDGLRLYPMRDDEGNGVGALFTSNKGCPTLPIL